MEIETLILIQSIAVGVMIFASIGQAVCAVMTVRSDIKAKKESNSPASEVRE